MKKFIAMLTLLYLSFGASLAFAMDGHATDGKKMSNNGGFMHKAVVEGVRAEFQIMSLASMKMTDPDGATHHVMVNLFDAKMDHPINDIRGKVKIISPSGAEQVVSLKDYSGTYAANFTFTEKGKYGVICLFKKGDGKHVVKFWYPHD